MSLVPVSPPPTAGEDDNRSTTGDDGNSAPTPPLSIDDSLAINSPSSPISQGPVKLTARSCLYETCAKCHWKRPVFACCDEKGPTNLRLFTYKAVVEMKESSRSRIVVECIGKPQPNKKSAADSAAEGVLWYLVRLGYPKKPDRSKKLRKKDGLELRNKEKNDTRSIASFMISSQVMPDDSSAIVDES